MSRINQSNSCAPSTVSESAGCKEGHSAIGGAQQAHHRTVTVPRHIDNGRRRRKLSPLRQGDHAAGLWDASAQVDRRSLPTIGMQDQVGGNRPTKSHEDVKQEYENVLTDLFRHPRERRDPECSVGPMASRLHGNDDRGAARYRPFQFVPLLRKGSDLRSCLRCCEAQ